jgi:hypothetical protein
MRSGPIAFLDWGIEDPTRIACGDTIQIAQPAPARPGVLYVTHTDDYRIVESETSGIISEAASHALIPTDLKTIPDSRGNPVLSVFSLQTAVAAAK